jgi:signal transduction histidine kinase
MSGGGQLTRAPNRQLGLMIALHALWVGLLSLLTGWWIVHMLRQAVRVSELSLRTGLPAAQAAAQLGRTQRMIYWEGGFFFLALLATGAAIFLVYWREQRRIRQLEAFFASVTHELRTPLTSIRLQAETIAEGGASPGTNLRRLLEDTMRLEGQVERALELARVEGGGAVVAQPLRVRSFLERFAEAWRGTYPETLEVSLKLEDTAVEADPSALQVIARNLFENAMRHSGRERVRITVEALRSNGGVELVFQDDGRGFAGAEKELGKLFCRGRHSQGAGVGLYLVRELALRMGGRVSFGSGGPAGAGGFCARLWLREAPSDG